MKERANYKKLLGFICLGFGCVLPSVVKAEGAPIYYDTFYEDYYKAFPDANPEKGKKTKYSKKSVSSDGKNVVGNITPANVAADPYLQTQISGSYAVSPVASYFQGSVDHNPKKWEVEARWKKNYGHFMFENDEDSILNWDETDATEYSFKVSKDFIVKNRQYVVSATYGWGDLKTSRTSDDDVYNSMHIISIGDGSADLKDYSIAVGARNFWKLGNWNITPYVGYKKKEQDFEMANHAVPAPFYLEAMCDAAGSGEPCENDFNPNTNVMYEAVLDIEGNFVKTGNAVPDSITFNGTNAVAPDGVSSAVSYGQQIPQEDFCFHLIDGSQEDGYYYCIEAGDDGANLLGVFGGVSSVFIQDGTTHMYHVNWTGPFVGLELERKMSDKEELRLYGEYFYPYYKVWGNWPNRDDWAHDPSFWDKGGKGMGFLFNLDYKYQIKSYLQLILGIEYEYIENKDADTLLRFSDGSESLMENSIRISQWKSYGFNLGVAFKL